MSFQEISANRSHLIQILVGSIDSGTCLKIDIVHDNVCVQIVCICVNAGYCLVMTSIITG